jgi:hypothetical protein
LSPALDCTDSYDCRVVNTQRPAKSIVAASRDEGPRVGRAVSSTVVRRTTLLPLALLLGYGVAFATTALGASLLVFDDHPGQLYRLWHVVTRGPAPWAWNPGWWGGYPELQFYPPGLSYVGALLHHATGGWLSVAAAYQTCLWIAYLAPGISTFLLLARLLGDGWLALPGAFVALTLSAGVASGVESGVRWGMVAARLGWALIPLLALVLIRWSDVASGDAPRRGAPFPSSAIVLLAGIVLTHPAHLPTAIAVVLLAAASGRGSRRARARAAAVGLAVAAVSTAFWTLPLIARLEHARPLAWGSLSAVLEPLATRPLAWALVLLATVVPWRHSLVGTAPGAPWGVARLPYVMLLVVAVDATVLERWGVRWLPADRVADGAWLAFVLGAGLATGRLLERGSRRWRLPLPVASLAAVAAAAVFSLPGGSLTLWARTGDWPTYGETARGLRLAELWTMLRAAPEGRVLFVRSGVPLVYGTAWYRPHTHITAITPVAAGRPIIHGTFTHPSPVAALVYRGDAGPGPITQLAERLDGRSLFGRPLDQLDARTFNRYAERLGISTVVALDEDVPALRMVVDNAEFAARASSPPFVVYRRDTASAVPTEAQRGRWQVMLAGEPGAWVPAGFAYYPLWRAASGEQSLAVRRGTLGELEVRLASAAASVELRYAAGLPEHGGTAISLVTVLVWIALAVRRRLGNVGGSVARAAGCGRGDADGSEGAVEAPPITRAGRS